MSVAPTLEELSTAIKAEIDDPRHAIELREMCEKYVENYLADSETNDGSLMPQVLVRHLDSSGKEQTTAFGLAIPFNTELEKHAGMAHVASRMFEQRTIPLAVALISEAWLSHQELDAPRQYLVPADDPQRQEVAIVMVMATDGTTWMQHRPVQVVDKHLRASGEWERWTEARKCASPLLSVFFRSFFACSPRAAEQMREWERAGKEASAT